VRVAYGPAPSQFGELRLPAAAGGPVPVAVVFHGGFWMAEHDLAHFAPFCDALAGHGVAAWSVEYRRVGEGGGGVPGTLVDALDGASFVTTLARSHPLDLARVVIAGFSAGGQLALWVASRQRARLAAELARPLPFVPRAVVSLAGVLDLDAAVELDLGRGATDRFLGADRSDRVRLAEQVAAASPAELLPLGVPTLLVHGADDDVVPFGMSRAYAERARALGDEVVLEGLPDCGHFELIDPRSKPWPRVARAILDRVGLVPG